MKKYDLEERTFQFALNTSRFLRKQKITIYNRNIIIQLLRSSQSIGANYREANGGSSQNDFRNKIFICKKESQETEYWLKLWSSLEEMQDNQDLDLLLKESRELVLIFNSITSKLRR